MKSLVEYITEGIDNMKYAICWYYYSDEPMSWSYQSSINRAKSFIKRMNKRGMKISEIFEVPTNNISEFKSLKNKAGYNDEKFRKLYNRHWNKDEIEKFLELK